MLALLLMVGVVLVVLGLLWWAGRDIKPDRNGPQENAEQVFREDL